MEYQQYINTVARMASLVDTPAESLRLIDWVCATIPDATGTCEEQHIASLSLAASYWSDNALEEDLLQPMLGLLYSILALAPYEQTAKYIPMVLAKQDAMVNSWMEMDDCSYEEFCDKYAHELNQ